MTLLVKDANTSVQSLSTVTDGSGIFELLRQQAETVGRVNPGGSQE